MNIVEKGPGFLTKRGHTPEVKIVTFESAIKARSFLEKMKDFIENNDFITINEYYILSGNSHFKGSTTYGWMRVGGSRIKKEGDVFYIDLPIPIRKW